MNRFRRLRVLLLTRLLQMGQDHRRQTKLQLTRHQSRKTIQRRRRLCNFRQPTRHLMPSWHLAAPRLLCLCRL